MVGQMEKDHPTLEEGKDKSHTNEWTKVSLSSQAFLLKPNDVLHSTRKHNQWFFSSFFSFFFVLCFYILIFKFFRTIFFSLFSLSSPNLTLLVTPIFTPHSQLPSRPIWSSKTGLTYTELREFFFFLFEKYILNRITYFLMM
jgi:hypothetical protein